MRQKFAARAARAAKGAKADPRKPNLDPEGPGFRLGTNKVYLPNHTITFVRKDRVPANWATFQVPLTFTKFDIRDYLWNLYGVKTTAWRSWVDASKAVRKPRGGYFRPQPKKFMMVQLEKPFAWPAPPEDLEPWNKKLWQARTDAANQHFKEQAKRQAGRLPYPSEQGPRSESRQKLAEEAKALLSGKKQWVEPEGLDSKWDRIAAAAKREREARAGVKEEGEEGEEELEKTEEILEKTEEKLEKTEEKQ